MILTNKNTQQPMYIKPESIIMATALIVPPQAAVPAVVAEDGTITTPAIAARDPILIPGCQIVISGLAQDRNAIMVHESATDVHNLCLAEMNNRKAKILSPSAN